MSTKREHVGCWMVCIGLAFVVLATAFCGRAEAGWLRGLWFEVGGSYSSLDPQMSEQAKAVGIDFPVTSIQGVFGLEIALHQRLGKGVGVYLRSAYAQGSRDYPRLRVIHLPPGTGRARTEQLVLIPITAGVDFRIPWHSLAMVFEFGGTIRIIKNKTLFDPNDMVIDREGQSWGAQGSVGLEWGFVPKLVCGFRAGYLVAENVEFSGFISDFTVPGNGHFFGIYIGFKPWLLKPSE